MPTRSTFLIFNILLLLQLLYGILTWYLIFLQGNGKTGLGGPEVIYLPVLLILLSAAAAWFIDNSRAKQARRYQLTNEIGQRRYRTTVLLRLSIIQAANLMALTLALSARRIDVMTLLIPGLFVFMFFRPSKEEFSKRYSH